jgi:hypothetical protein
MLANVRLACNDLTWTNALAYYPAASMTKKKSVIKQFGASSQVSDGLDNFLKEKQKFSSSTTERFDLEVIKPGRPEVGFTNF